MQGWQHERIVKWDARQGRVLLVLQSDPATHLKKVSMDFLLHCTTHAHMQPWKVRTIDPMLLHQK